MEQRYFKVISSISVYHAQILPLWCLSDHDGVCLKEPTGKVIVFLNKEVEEVFNHNPISDKVEEVADLVFSKTHLDNYDGLLRGNTTNTEDYDLFVNNKPIDEFLDSKGERWIEETESLVGKRVFESGSMRDNDDNKPLPMELHPYLLMRYGFHMKTGSLNYGRDNWAKKQPSRAVWDSYSRHFMQAYMCEFFPEDAKKLGYDQEDHLSACQFALNMLMMNDLDKGIEPNHFFIGK